MSRGVIFGGMALVGLACFLGCREPRAEPASAIELKPPQAVVTCGRGLRFGYRVSQSDYLPLVWSVQEHDGGSIDAGGNFQAPDHPGDFTIIAEAKGHPSTRGVAKVHVVLKPNGTIQAPTRIEIGQKDLLASVPTVAGSRYQWTIQGGRLISAADRPVIRFNAGKGPRAVLKCRVTNAAGDALTSSLELPVLPKPKVKIQPNQTVLTVGARLRFGYELEGASKDALRWEVPDPAHGSIDGEGNYQAPATSGYCRVRVGLAMPGATGDEAMVQVVERPMGTIEAPQSVKAGTPWIKVCVAEQMGMTYRWRVRGGTILYGDKESCITVSPGPGPDLELTCIIANAAGATLELIRSIKVEAPKNESATAVK